MKNISFISNRHLILFVFLMATLACKETPISKPDEVPSATTITSDSIPSSEQGISFVEDKSRGVFKQEAIDFTKAYYDNPDPGDKEKMVKSVYFKEKDLQKFLDDVSDSNLCREGEIGYRFYFAKYPDTYHDEKLRGKHTIIIRATCNGADIPHKDREGDNGVPFVAFDFGDVCPPLCNPNNLATQVMTGGKYDPNGNCSGCTSDPPTPTSTQKK